MVRVHVRPPDSTDISKVFVQPLVYCKKVTRSVMGNPNIMNTQKAAKWFGIIFLVIGVLGFVGPLAPGGKLLGIFAVDAVHNIIHILSGLVALFLAGSAKGARSYFQIFGIVYALVTILGLFGSGSILGIFVVNGADNILHLIIAVLALYLGFSGSKQAAAPMQSQGGMQM